MASYVLYLQSLRSLGKSLMRVIGIRFLKKPWFMEGQRVTGQKCPSFMDIPWGSSIDSRPFI